MSDNFRFSKVITCTIAYHMARGKGGRKGGRQQVRAGGGRRRFQGVTLSASGERDKKLASVYRATLLLRILILIRNMKYDNT